jgi:hypothetical protein
MKTLFSLALSILSFAGFSQSFSGKTNRIGLDYSNPVIATTLPTIDWISPRMERSNSTNNNITFEADISSDVVLKAVHIEWKHGGETRTKDIPIQGEEYKKSIQQQLFLLDGENTVILVVENIKGGKVSSERSVLTGKDHLLDGVALNRKDKALLIAIDNYDNFDELSNPINDARTIASILKDKYGFEIELLENPTNDEILGKITDYNEKKFNPQDQLFIFFAGHGVFDATLGEGYVVARNSLKNDKGKSSYVSHILLRERINNIKCEHIFLVMDVCFGGTIDPVLAKAVRTAEADEEADLQYLVKKLTKRTRKFLTSGSKEYVPDGTPGKHSPFAEKFILALREIGGGSGRILSTVELRPYFLKLSSEPRFGSFGNGDDSSSDFVFVAK